MSFKSKSMSISSDWMIFDDDEMITFGCLILFACNQIKTDQQLWLSPNVSHSTGFCENEPDEIEVL